MSDVPGPIAAFDTSPEGQLLNATVNAVIDLDLPAIEGNVWLRTPPTLKGISQLPVVLVSAITGSHLIQDGTLTSPDFVFRQALAFVYPGERESNEYLPDRLLVQHQLLLQFAKNADAISATLVDGVQYLYSGVEMGDPRLLEKWRENLNAGFIFIYHRVRYPSTA
jgi:hypothetical protein